MELRVPPAVVWVVCAALMRVVSGAAASLAISIPTPPAAGLIAFFALNGVAMISGSLDAFRRAQTTPHPMRPHEATALITHGIYRYTRNPIYLGMALLLLAWAVYLANPVSLAGIILFVVYITRFQILPEERALRRIFKDEYDAYCRSVRRWL